MWLVTTLAQAIDHIRKNLGGRGLIIEWID